VTLFQDNWQEKRLYNSLNEKWSKGTIKKMVFLTTVLEAYHLFKGEHPDIKFEKSKFAALRPVQVSTVLEKDHRVCCCRYHENVDLLLQGLKKHAPASLPPTDSDLLERFCCCWCVDCYFGKCEKYGDLKTQLDNLLGDIEMDIDASVEFHQWTTSSRKERCEMDIS
jgi:hypothetical protein